MKTHNADTARTFPARTACATHTVPAFNPDGSAVAVVKRKRAFGHCRVSTDMQAQFGLSLEAQQSQIAAYAKACGYEVISFYVDHESAKNVTGRPEYQKMIAEVDKGKVNFIISSALALGKPLNTDGGACRIFYGVRCITIARRRKGARSIGRRRGRACARSR